MKKNIGTEKEMMCTYMLIVAYIGDLCPPLASTLLKQPLCQIRIPPSKKIIRFHLKICKTDFTCKHI